jgi:phosphoribosyl-AMP cyclohydrolase
MTTDPSLRFDEQGLIPVVVQDSTSGEVLMQAFMNEEALDVTRRTGRSHFWSRSRQQLWKKGEISGHEQIVDDIFVNCERNSLLLHVRQIGAVCHDGYDTCYYRKLEPDGSLRTVRERNFDPRVVYGDGLASLSEKWYGAYRFLSEHDLHEVSATSARLKDPTFRPALRVADELRELAGVLNETHRHGEMRSDALLEGTQVLYWLALTAVELGLTWHEIRPDRALETSDQELDRASVAKMLLAEADRSEFASAASIHAAMALVAQACAAMSVTARELLEAELAELKSKPYLASYFARP